MHTTYDRAHLCRNLGAQQRSVQTRVRRYVPLHALQHVHTGESFGGVLIMPRVHRLGWFDSFFAKIKPWITMDVRHSSTYTV